MDNGDLKFHLDNISGQTAQVDLGGFGCGAPAPSLPVILLS